MSTKNLFEYATRMKLRFPYRGQISVEDLWDLNVKALDGVFKTLNQAMKATQEESLLQTRSAEDEKLAAEIEIVKYIVGVKLAEDEARKNEAENREKRQKILGIIADKQDADLKGKSVEELQKMLETL